MAQTDIDELRHENGRDQREIDNALIDLYHARGIAPKGCWPLLAAVLIGVAYDGIVMVECCAHPSGRASTTGRPTCWWWRAT